MYDPRRAGAEDALEEPPAELRSATEANGALFLAEVHWRLDHKDLACRCEPIRAPPGQARVVARRSAVRCW